MLFGVSKNIILILLLSLLVACAYTSSNVQLVSNANAYPVNKETISCELTDDIDKSVHKTQGLNPENISLLNWNIYKGDGENWLQDLSAFAQSHNVMTIQEASLGAELTGLLEFYDFSWIMNTAFYLNGTASGVMTVASVDVISSCGFQVKEPFIRIPKSTLISYYAISGSDEKLLVANIHGINFTLGLDVYREQLTTLVRAVEHHQGPMIVAGDFNSWSEERLAEVDRLVKVLSLSQLDYPINNKTHVFGNAIDHVFYRQLELLNNQIIQVSSSDHNPISVSFRYQPEIQRVSSKI